MKVQRAILVPATIILGIAAGSASADYLFSFSGTVITDNGSGELENSEFTLNMFIQDLATDQTVGANMGTYRILSAQMDIGSDGVIEESFLLNQLADQAVYIDAGSTQLVGAFDLGGSFATFLFGVHIPQGAFVDPHDLAGQGSFSYTNLQSSSFSFYQSSGLNLALNLTGFAFDNTITVVPLPPAGIAGLGLLGAVGLRRRMRR